MANILFKLIALLTLEVFKILNQLKSTGLQRVKPDAFEQRYPSVETFINIQEYIEVLNEVEII